MKKLNQYATTTIFVTTEFVGFHQWPDAPDHLKYLRSLHRHVFKVRVERLVPFSRSVEFHEFKQAVEKYIEENIVPCLSVNPTMSCENIATEVLYSGVGGADYDELRVTVSEDGECGATVEGFSR